MDLNYILIWLSGLSCLSITLRLVKAGVGQNKGWFGVSLGILVVLAALYFASPETAGLISGSLWILLIVLPNYGLRILSKLLFQFKYDKAYRLAQILAVLHPYDGWRSVPEVVRALVLLDKGETSDAARILSKHNAERTFVGRLAILQLFSGLGEWEGLLRWIEDPGMISVVAYDPVLITARLRALGETGRLDEMLQLFHDSAPVVEGAESTEHADVARLFVFSFCGWVEGVSLLLRGPLKSYPEAIQKFWLATAEMATGNSEIALADFRILVASDDGRIQKAAERRLEVGLAYAPNTVSGRGRELLQEAQRHIGEDLDRDVARYGTARPWASYGFIAINVGLYLYCQLVFNTDDPISLQLYEVGALVPHILPDTGEYWRLATATVLHFNFLHLAMNMLGLYFLAPFVELSLGWSRFIGCYLVSSIGSMGIITYLTLNEGLEQSLLVGASGGVMALIGATAAILLRAWRKQRSKVLQRQLSVVGLIVAFQVVFDVSTPQVSFTAHFSGMVIGFLIASWGPHQGFARSSLRVGH